MYKQLYVDYHEKLLKLPMQDSTFIAKLNARNLLPGDTRNKIEGQTNPSDKASYFLKHIIEPSIDIDEGNSFKKLLSVMEECDYDHMKHLALEIKSKINGSSTSKDKSSKKHIDESSKKHIDESSKKHTAESSKKHIDESSKKRNVVKCSKCLKRAKLVKVKDSSNITYGYHYYSCPYCDTFIGWKNTKGLKCHCKQIAKTNITRKEGPNYGKWFYKCKNNKCKFFAWGSKAKSARKQKN